MIDKIRTDFDEGRLKTDLQKYVQLALDRKAKRVKVIPAHKIPLDVRVKYKCQYPVCRNYNTSINCPPHTASVEQMRELIQAYKYVVVLALDFPSERIVAEGGEGDNIEDRRLMCYIVSAVESQAFYDGYYFAMGFGAGPCRPTWCKGQTCRALEGKGCSFLGLARASMESVGIDVYRLATELGWDIYPIGRSCKPGDVPHGLRLGLVLIA